MSRISGGDGYEEALECQADGLRGRRGGGESGASGGTFERTYELTFTVGQPYPGRMRGGTYWIDTGFWGSVDVRREDMDGVLIEGDHPAGSRVLRTGTKMIARLPPGVRHWGVERLRPRQLSSPFSTRFAVAVCLVFAFGTCSPDGLRAEGDLAPAEIRPAADWPIFRGDAALTGRAEGALPDELEFLWRFKTEEPVRSSAVIVGERVFVGSDDGSLYALGLVSGEKSWSFATEGAVEAPPLVMGGRVYVGSSDGVFYCLDAASGKKLWDFPANNRILGGANWHDDATTDGATVIFGSYDSKLYGLRAADGEHLWTYSTDNFINGSPAVAGGRAVFGGCDAFVHVVSLADGKRAGAVEAGAYIAGSVALAGGRAYIGHYNNAFLSVDLDADKIEWEYTHKPYPFFSSAAVDAERVVFGGRDKFLHCVDRRSGKPIWKFKTGGEVNSSPVICGDKVVVGSDDGRLYVVGLADGREIWSYEIGDAIEASPAVSRGVVVVGSLDGYVYAFGAEQNSARAASRSAQAPNEDEGT